MPPSACLKNQTKLEPSRNWWCRELNRHGKGLPPRFAATLTFGWCFAVFAVWCRSDGSPVCWFGRTVIHSRASMTYDQASSAVRTRPRPVVIASVVFCFVFLFLFFFRTQARSLAPVVADVGFLPVPPAFRHYCCTLFAGLLFPYHGHTSEHNSRYKRGTRRLRNPSLVAESRRATAADVSVHTTRCHTRSVMNAPLPLPAQKSGTISSHHVALPGGKSAVRRCRHVYEDFSRKIITSCDVLVPRLGRRV